MEKTDNIIGIGDVAYVYRGCIHCGDAADLGQIIKVTEIKTIPRTQVRCCKTADCSPIAFYGEGPLIGKFLWGLKKIPPIQELEGIRSQEDKPAEIT